MLQIYPSQFGMERMKEEEEKGPTELVQMKLNCNTEVDEEVRIFEPVVIWLFTHCLLYINFLLVKDTIFSYWGLSKC